MGSYSKKAEPASGRQGFALMVVIVVMLLASFLASQLILLVRTELQISHNIKSRVVGHFLAEAGLSLGLFRLFEPRPMDIPELGSEEDWEQFIQGYEYQVYLPKGKVSYYVSSESGKIDLNKAPPTLMRIFLEHQLGSENEDQIDIILDSLADWRDSDDLHRINGAESEVYGNLDDPYIARNGKIEDPAEFFLINGTDVLAGKFYAQEIFTVLSPKANKINFNSLTPAMLDFLTGGDDTKKEAYREAQKEFKGRLNTGLAQEILGEMYGEIGSYLSYTSPRNNKYYFIVGAGYADVTEEEDALAMDLMDNKKKTPGTMNSLLIKKESSSKYTSLAWQERNI